MRPTPVPDHEIWDGAVRRVISPPGGDLDSGIAPVEALLDTSPDHGCSRLSVRNVLEDGDLEKLAAGGTVWVTFWGGMIPWTTTVLEHQPAPGEPPTPASELEQLRRWKAEALEVIAGLQDLGRALGLRPGERITGAAALAAVEQLRVEAGREDPADAARCRGCDSRQDTTGTTPEFPSRTCPVHGHLPGAR